VVAVADGGFEVPAREFVALKDALDR